MKKELNPSSYKPIVDAIKRFNFTIFLVVIVSALIFAVILLNGVVKSSAPSSSGATPGGQSTEAPPVFDNATIDELNQLKTSDQNSPSSLPNARTNPFR